MLSAGYTDSTAATHAKDVVGNPRVKRALAEILSSCDYDKKLQRVYDGILEREQTGNLQDDLKIDETKLKAAHLLHKIRGDFAPQKIDSRSVKFNFTKTRREDD
jgi:hypothetical protein